MSFRHKVTYQNGEWILRSGFFAPYKLYVLAVSSILATDL